MKQNENDQNHKKESTPVVNNKPNGKSQINATKKLISELLTMPPGAMSATAESESFFKRSHPVIVALTVPEILDGHPAMDLVFMDREANL